MRSASRCQQRGVLVFAGVARHHRHAGRLHQDLGAGLAAHPAHRLGARADELEAGLGHRFGEIGVLAEEAEAGVDRLRAGGERRLDDAVAAQVGIRRPRAADPAPLVRQERSREKQSEAERSREKQRPWSTPGSACMGARTKVALHLHVSAASSMSSKLRICWGWDQSRRRGEKPKPVVPRSSLRPPRLRVESAGVGIRRGDTERNPSQMILSLFSASSASPR